MLGSTAWFALMRRNMIYRQRNWFSTIMELFLPIMFVLIMVSIRNAATTDKNDKEDDELKIVPSFIPGTNETIIPFTFSDYVMALQGERYCTTLADETLEITGIWSNSNGWPVPFVKCDSYLCEYLGQDALSFCEYFILAVAPYHRDDEMNLQRSEKFIQWIYQRYPILLQTGNRIQQRNEQLNLQRKPKLPFQHDFIQLFQDKSDMDTYTQLSTYGTSSVPKIGVGIIWGDSDGGDNNQNPYLYTYEVRPNSTNYNGPERGPSTRIAVTTTPNTQRLFNHYAHTDSETCTLPLTDAPDLGPLGDSCTGQYLYNGVIAIQRLIHDYIIDETQSDIGSGTTKAGVTTPNDPIFVGENGIGITQMPTRPFNNSGFFKTVEDFAPIIFILGLLYPIAAMISYIVREKELRQKELMKIMSVTETDINHSWFVTFWLLNILTGIICTGASCVLYEESSPILLFLFWQCTMLCNTVYSQCIAAITSKTTRGVLIGLLFYFVGVFLSLTIDYQDGGSGTNGSKRTGSFSGSVIMTFLCFHPATVFAYAIKEIGRFEDQNIGLTFDTVTIAEGTNGYHFLRLYQFYILDIGIYSFFTWYFNRVIAPDYGSQALPYWFCFQPSYWFPQLKTTTSTNTPPTTTTIEEQPQFQLKPLGGAGFDSSSIPHGPTMDDEGMNGTSPALFGRTTELNRDGIPVEPVPPNLLRQSIDGTSIELKQVRKVYESRSKGSTVTAIDQLTLSMYSGQITALLGHNGAGKTTTMNILTGTTSITSGSVSITGYDVQKSHMLTTQIRKNMGICFQHDCLFPSLTVREHLQFFARIKGAYNNNNENDSNHNDMVEKEIDQAIRDVALYEKRNTLSKNLSGGMKRKLSVAIAFCGGSKIVLLDEPTSGMDPFSRRFTWNVIRQYRQGRCIILTTHFMDEADILGDRIAIMSEGRLRCCGSSLFLKRYYGVGYHLTIEMMHGNHQATKDNSMTAKRIKNDAESSDDDDDEPSGMITYPKPATGSATIKDASIQQIIKSSVPESTLISNVGTELSYQLPVGAASRFVQMFRKLDDQVDAGVVTSYGISITTLDEVFLLVTRGNTFNKFNKSARALEVSPTEDTDVTAETALNVASNDPNYPSFKLEEDSSALFFRHLKALLFKRIVYFKRDKVAWVCTSILPSLFVFVGFLVFVLVGKNRDLQPLTLDLNDYNDGVTETPMNPISFNSPNTPYHCTPGVCMYRKPILTEHITGENVLYCGYATKLQMTASTRYDHTNITCTVPETDDILATLTEAGATPVPFNTDSVYASSQSLLDTSNIYAATQYGSIWFTHFPTSTMQDGRLFQDAVIEQCLSASAIFNYTRAEECNRIGGVGYVVSYNFTALHSAPLFVTLADQAIARYGSKNNNVTIRTTIAPLPITVEERSIGAAENALTAWFLVILSFPFISGAYASFVVAERTSKAKHLQTVAGVNPFAYWLSTFLWDTLNYQIPLWITVCLMFIFDVNILTTSARDTFSGIFALLFFFGPASAGFTYCISFAFKSASFCNVFVIIFGFIVGLGGPLTCYILRLLAEDNLNPRPSLKDVSELITSVLRFVPTFCLGKGLFNVINIETLAFFEDDPDLSAWDDVILRLEVYYLATQCVVYPILAVLIDIGYTNPTVMSFFQCFSTVSRCASTSHTSNDSSIKEDDDVVREERLVNSGKADSKLVVIKKLSKVYSTGKKAVNNLSLAIPPGQCFGLLGINGAGKTTTMGMLTAEFPPSSGDAILASYSITRAPQMIRRRIGYCPQFDAHFPHLTGREHVELYASIKGVPSIHIKEVALRKLAEVGLSVEDGNRVSSDYSGGMKRRLSLACATIGAPKIIMLDEPSTGVDPISRREIWQMISEIVAAKHLPQAEKPSVILTTHSMEECEALCPRIGIMANGRLSCLGSAQHLKDKFGKGYQIELKTRNVKRQDDDYKIILEKLNSFPAVAIPAEADNVKCFDLDECRSALQKLTPDQSLVSLVSETNEIGSVIWNSASSPVGISVHELAAFATSQIRIQNVEKFMNHALPNNIVRERQDTKVRYEVDREGIRIGTIFSKIEEHKDELLIADYSVSQTSLEQVFNMHAAQAERIKEGRNDR